MGRLSSLLHILFTWASKARGTGERVPPVECCHVLNDELFFDEITFNVVGSLWILNAKNGCISANTKFVILTAPWSAGAS